MKLFLRLLALSVLLAAAAALALGYHAYQRAHQPYKGYPEEEIFFTVQPGAAGATIARELAERGVVEDRRLFLAALWLEGATGRIQAGEYRFSEPLSPFEIVDRLARGDVHYLSLTIPEGLTVLETARLFSDQGFGQEEALRSAFLRGDLIAELDPEAEDLEGYLFPDTYRFSRNPHPEQVARVMVARFTEVLNELRAAGAEEDDDDPLPLRKLVTLASIVEKETGHPDERPIVASVFHNRLRRGMPLQSDPTIIYALKRLGIFDGNLRRPDLKLDSPYNTYVVPGLPPGPIASPGRASLQAVLEPAETSYLYFVSRNDGSHHFSSTLREHSAAVRKYQIEYFRRRRQENREPGPR